jgi:hypothetical protein
MEKQMSHDRPDPNDVGRTQTLLELDRQIAFNRKWRRITSISYFTGASLSIISTVTASVVAGFGHAPEAAIVAAAATVFTSLDKVLLFREKWSHHRTVESELEIVRLGFVTRQWDDKGVFERITTILRHYAGKMPLADEAKVTT